MPQYSQKQIKLYMSWRQDRLNSFYKKKYKCDIWKMQTNIQNNSLYLGKHSLSALIKY